MKEQTNTLIFLLLLFCGKVFSQNPFNDTSGLTRYTDKGEFLVDDTRLGSISYGQPFGVSTHVTVLLRKGTNMKTGSVDKGIVFTTTLTEPDNNNAVFCFIGQEELDDAIRALQYINDSLLSRVPDHDVEYTYNFPSSPAQLFAYYNIYFADRKPKWSIVFDFDRNVNDTNWITIENKDCLGLIDLLKTAKERLRNY